MNSSRGIAKVDGVRNLPARPHCPTGGIGFVSGTRSKHLQRQRVQGWNQDILRLGFGACADVEVHSNLTVQDAQAAVVRASRTWNAVGLPLRFEVTEVANEADVVVAWKFASADPEGTLN